MCRAETGSCLKSDDATTKISKASRRSQYDRLRKIGPIGHQSAGTDDLRFGHTHAARVVASAQITATSSAMIRSDQSG
jgi:hypothetical protein